MAKILNLSNEVKINRNNIQPLENNAYIIYGEIANSSNDTILGTGIVTVVKISENILKIDYSYKITSYGTAINVFYWGLNRDILVKSSSELAKLNITPISGGSCEMYDTNYNLISDLQEFGGINIANNQFWTPSRYNGTINGSWASQTMKNKNVVYIKGVCYATYY